MLVSSTKLTMQVRYIGCSNMTGWQLQLAAMLGKQLNIGRYVVLQQQYSLLCREVEWEVRRRICTQRRRFVVLGNTSS